MSEFTKPDPSKKYRGWDLGDSEDVAAAAFIKRYGQPPEQILEYKRVLWVGPIPTEESKWQQLHLTTDHSS